MSHPRDAKGVGNVDFNWGRKRTIGSSKDHIYHESFKYDGVEYFLYDSVYLWRNGELEPYIGKLVNMWQTANHKNYGKVVWFFRPSAIQWHLRGLEPLPKEIFLASGEGKGLYNINPLEAISGKCHVVCTSKDKRNPRASNEELGIADFIFRRTFDVGSCLISEKFPDVIAGHKVEHFFNQRKDQEVVHHPKPVRSLNERPARSTQSSKFEMERTVGTVRKEQSWRSSDSDNNPPKKRKVEDTSGGLKVKPSKAPKQIVEKPKGVNEPQVVEPIRRPFVDSSKWFNQQPWEERLQKAHGDGSLVLLENLDPSYTSSEVEEMAWHALMKRVSAKMIQRSTFSSPHYGQALVIFKSKYDADLAISELNKKCLMLNGRPVVGRRTLLKEPGNSSKLVGHLVIAKMKFQKQHVELKNAVSTSHCSQPNTIEYEMAMEWRVLQMGAKKCWDALHEQQGKEIADVKSQHKAPRVYKQPSMDAAKKEKRKDL